ncbi:hypothetical protein HID58_094900 [Brassica napus]|uniref:Flavodoxin-like domain-containing protein n=1 Tax=Brassica napus TaxID=3708 RepID=A0ABQ7X7W7_BRANA|nr:hypothetical protein HID58_094900 [Brassica napus]
MLHSVLAVKLNAEAVLRLSSPTTNSTRYSSLPHEDAILFVVSTTGKGDSPDSFKEFWRFLLQRNLGNSWLQRVRFAVFGLGDSGYQKYNILGPHHHREEGLGDDQHPSWYGTKPSVSENFWSTSTVDMDNITFLLKEEAYHPARLLNLNLPSSLESDNWNAASYDSLKNAEVMSPLIIVSHCPHDGGLLFFMGTKLHQCLGVSLIQGIELNLSMWSQV